MNGTNDETKLDFTVEELKAVPELNLKSYMELVDHLGQGIEQEIGVPRIVPIIQSAHESRYGNSGLARNHCNLFGITASEVWKSKGGKIANLPTWEFINGKKVEMKREFRAYDSWKESFINWGEIITKISVYKDALQLLRDKKIEEGIKELGKYYATDPIYAKKLVQIFRMVTGI